MDLSKLSGFMNMTPELQKRIIAAGVLIPIVILVLLSGEVLFSVLVLLVALLMHTEWYDMLATKKGTLSEGVMQNWRWAGIAYVAAPAMSLIYMRHIEQTGVTNILFMMLLIWATDIAAYFTGRIVGGPKLIPNVSPNKTIAGLVGGMVAAAIVGAFASMFMGVSSVAMAFLGLFTAMVAQASDLYESWIKRQFAIKDSGTLIPGHGGVMDRVDSFVFVSPLFAFLTFINNGSLL